MTFMNKLLQDGVEQKIIYEFIRISFIAWVHILFTGKYNFQKSTGSINIAAMTRELEKHLKNIFGG
jgi:hypothetical protein